MSRWLVCCTLLCVLILASFGCHDDGEIDFGKFFPPRQAPPPSIVEPAGDVVVDFSFEVAVVLPADAYDTATLAVTLNGVALAVMGGPERWSIMVAPGAPLRDDNEIEVSATRKSDGKNIVARKPFQYLPPKARARIIDDPADLIQGPLAHGRVGDYLLENAEARFVVQDVAQRDLYSVGAFGGNIIDAELVGRPGLDNFLEVQTMINVETVLNAQELTIVNDGQNGLAAVISVCGPDDLLDFVNPSSAVADANLPYPADADDKDQKVWACTDYSLEPGETWVKLDTEVFNNNEPGDPETDLPLIVGDWMNAGGELDVFNRPGQGWGAPGLARMGALAFTGINEAGGVDYSYTTTPDPSVGVTWVVSISGVTVIMHHAGPAELLGGTPPFVVPFGGSLHTVRYLGVGDGSPSNAIDLANRVKGLTTGTIQGVVSIGGVPAAHARVSVAKLASGQLGNVVATFDTDEQGRYSGSVLVPVVSGDYGVVAARNGALYEGGGPTPPIEQVTFSQAGQVETLDFDLPAPAQVHVSVTDEQGAVPARITVVGFDPSPEPTVTGTDIFGDAGELGLFYDMGDSHPFGVVAVAYADANGDVTFDVEPGVYQLYVSRGPEYSLFELEITPVGGQTTEVVAQIARVLDTPGFVSSDFHVHGINSADSRVSHRRRALGYAAEGIDNIVMTDHHVHTDLSPVIADLGLQPFVTSTIGEEITSFDYGHFNAYPLAVDPSRPSKGSTDWGVAAPPGEDFPAPLNGSPAYNATPAEIAALATAGANSLPDTTIQVNHIGSHFTPLQIDTGVTPITDGLDTPEKRLARRLDPGAGNLFHPFPALELWNGTTRGAQAEFLVERIGIWMNLLHAGYATTAIADTDTHRFASLRSAGAATWTAASAGADTPATLESGEVARAVTAGQAVGGQGIFVLTRLVQTGGGGDVADLTATGKTHMSDPAGNVTLQIEIQAPIWARYDTIEVYANATTQSLGAANPYAYTALPTLTHTQAGADFDVVQQVVNAGVPGASRWVTSHSVDFTGLATDTWFVVVVKGTDGISEPMFPVYAANLDTAGNLTKADLVDGNLDEGGVMALGFSNALYFDAPVPP